MAPSSTSRSSCVEWRRSRKGSGLQVTFFVIAFRFHQTVSTELPAGLLARLRQRLREILPVHIAQQDVPAQVSRPIT